MEDKRTEMTEDAILEFFRRAIEVTDGVPFHFIFNMNEMGHQDWAHRGEQTCVVPAAHHDDYVYMPVSRAGKRITLMACIAADGSAIKPQIIIPRKTIDDDLVLTGSTKKIRRPIIAKGICHRAALRQLVLLHLPLGTGGTTHRIQL
jgi:hypothetical protein